MFYRTESTTQNSEPTDTLTAQEFVRDEDVSWSEINELVRINANAQDKRVISVGSTFRNVGEEKLSVIMSIDGQNTGQKVFMHAIESQDPWDDVIEQAKLYLETYILPHEFAGLVFYEEEHPLNEREAVTGTRNITIYHTAGEQPTPIKEQPDTQEIIVSNIW